MESIFDPQVVQTNKPITIETQISSIAASLIYSHSKHYEPLLFTFQKLCKPKFKTFISQIFYLTEN